MMEHSGLGGLITEFFINVANKDTFPVMTFFSSALINFAVPSGGGHWVIQGPFVMPAAQALGADLGKSVMAIAYGEQWMNMAQPFWALPAQSPDSVSATSWAIASLPCSSPASFSSLV